MADTFSTDSLKLQKNPFQPPVCDKIPASGEGAICHGTTDHIKGFGRQVSFRVYSATPTYTDWMKARIDSDEGKRIYSHRMSTVEPVFANLEHNKGLKRFSLRGKNKKKV